MAVTKDMNMGTMMEHFHSNEKCRAYLESLRWPDGVQCPRCESMAISNVYDRGQFECNSCRYQFSVMAGTIFHDSHLPLWKWFLTIYMMLESRKGVSANQIKRTIDVSYKTAWYLCHRIRNAMKEKNQKKLSGIAEVDETFIGGKQKGSGKGTGIRKNKTIVVGAIQRNGDVRMKIIKANDRKTLHNFIREHTKPDTEMIVTDELPAYRGIKDHDTNHQTVNHKLKEWARGKIHTNSIENVWSFLNRSIIGSYHNVSAKHLDAYLDELEWRFNHRENPYLFRDTLMKLVSSENLEYQELVAS